MSDEKSTLWYDKLVFLCYAIENLADEAEKETDADTLSELAQGIAEELFHISNENQYLCDNRTMVDAAITVGKATLEELRGMK